MSESQDQQQQINEPQTIPEKIEGDHQEDDGENHGNEQNRRGGGKFHGGGGGSVGGGGNGGRGFRGRGRGRGGGRGRGRGDSRGDGDGYRKRGFDDRFEEPSSSYGFGNDASGFNSKFNEKLRSLSQATLELPPLDTTEKKFNGRNRLYVGNIGVDCTEDELKELFTPYGEVQEVFINKEKSFCFLRMDYRVNAEKAKRDLDGQLFKDRFLRIRFAPPNSSLKIKNLPSYVTNELLYHAFSVFGEIERAIVNVDEKGKPTGEGIIDFLRKGSATHALRQCTNVPFFLTASLRPCVVENFDYVDDSDGYPESHLPKKNQEYVKMRSVGPHFAQNDSFEYALGNRYKQIYELYEQKLKVLKNDLEMDLEKIDAQIEYSRYEYETEQLRKELRQREMDQERHKPNFDFNYDDRRPQQRQQQQLQLQHQENSLFIQANQLNDILTQAENSFGRSSPFGGGGGGGAVQQESSPGFNEEPKPFVNNYNRSNNRGYDNRSNMGQSRPHGSGGGGHWVNANDNRRDDGGPKRRRF